MLSNLYIYSNGTDPAEECGWVFSTVQVMVSPGWMVRELWHIQPPADSLFGRAEDFYLRRLVERLASLIFASLSILRMNLTYVMPFGSLMKCI